MAAPLPAGPPGRLCDVGLLRATAPADLVDAPFTYAEVGATRDAELPAGYDAVERSVVVGSGTAAFERTAAAVFDWRMQRRVGRRGGATRPAGGSARKTPDSLSATISSPRHESASSCAVDRKVRARS